MPKSRSPSRKYHHGDLKNALIAQAIKMLEHQGPEAISLRALARAVGVSQTAPYNHFKNKEHLLAAVAAMGMRKFTAWQIQAAQLGDTRDRVQELGRAYVRFAFAFPQLYRLMFGVGIANEAAYPDLLEAQEASYKPIQEALAAHLHAVGKDSSESIEIAAVTAWALVHGLSTLMLDGVLDIGTNDPKAIEAFVARITTWFSAGLEAGADAITDESPKNSEPNRHDSE